MNTHALRHDVITLATAAGRMVGTAGHEQARGYLAERLAGLGLDPYGERFELPYAASGARLCNVIGVAPGTQPELAPIVLAAHYDTCGPLPGADDNAAAIAIALRVAEQLRAEPAPRGVVIALFDGEEPPHYLSPAMGSIHWYHHQRRGPVHCAVVLDLVGHDVPVPGIEDLVFVTGMESDPELVIDLAGVSDSVRVQPVLNRYVGDLSDHHVFRAHERPFLFLSCGRWQHYHMPTDTPDRLNYAKMAGIAELVELLVRRVSAAQLSGPFEGGDTLALELAGVERHFGKLLGGAAKLVGRRGVDAFVKLAMGGFGL
ncbi:Aminopeptidase [Enhygromyxa salina]|uniref:Aminopeptidase n=1 Tax=Enhygromyxa salina TaxID=215803 RepID=A0A0C1ZRR2_9BACT|nr:M28 family peptidase [Enhygromyxa salina]KIG13713.1 Aminopeptidase [Enhygromyxa salina]